MPDHQLDKDLTLLLHDVGRLIRVRFDQYAKTYGATRAQWIVLARLERRPGLSQSELADILEIEPISVARIIDRMEARGLVIRRADETDRRIWRLYNLPAATDTLDDIKRIRDIFIAQLLESFDMPSEAFLNVLVHIKKHLAE